MRKSLYLKESLYFLNITGYALFWTGATCLKQPGSPLLLNDRNYYLFGPEEEGNRCDLD